MLCLRDTPKIRESGGSSLRSLQIAELIADAGHSLVDLLERDRRPSDWRERMARWRDIRWMARHSDIASAAGPFKAKRSAMQYRHLRSLIEQLPAAGCFIWEQTQRHGTLAAARTSGLKTIALPHNIESLVRSEQLMYAAEDDDVHARFRKECQELARADHIVTISERDRWLLSLFGLKADVLPYFPPVERRRWLEAIRARRQRDRAQRRLLVLGTATYPPNFHGMRDILQALERALSARPDIALDVVGHGTESLAQYVARPTTVCHGSVSQEVLRSHLEAASAAVVSQNRSTTGALTRIADYLVAGIPVLANREAARSYEDADGVHVFDDIAHCVALCGQDATFAMPESPSLPVRSIARFLAILDSGDSSQVATAPAAAEDDMRPVA